MPNRIAATAVGLVVVASLLATTPASPASAAAVVPDAVSDLGVDVVLTPVATVPDSSFGAAPRLNAMAVNGDRLFVVEERDGHVYELTGPNPSLGDESFTRSTSLYLDVGAAMAAAGTPLDTSSVFHGGLRSIAFHPDFASNGLLYASAMALRPADPSLHRYLSDADTPIAADSVLLEFTADPGTGIVDPASLREVFRVGMPVYDHPIKQIAFDHGLDEDDPGYGLLYIGHGDGSVQSAIAGGGQNDDALGKVLRIDPRESGDDPYAVPIDNPFVGDPTMLDEVYSLGHRNPHSLAFVSAPTGRALVVAEPGRDNVEEINVITPGADYGWPQREGTFVHLAGGGVQTGIDPLPVDEASNGFVFPAAQYGHAGDPGTFFNGTSVVGGFAIDNGSELDGHYFFADFPVTGDLYHSPTDALFDAITVLDDDDPTRDEPDELSQAPIGLADVFVDHDGNADTPPLARDSLRDVFDDAATYETTRADVRFGHGPDGELYITSKRNNTIYLVVNSLGDPDDQDPDPDPDPDPDDPDDEPDPGVDDEEREPTTIAEATSVDDLVHATDYTPDDARILRLYRAFFDREPELAGARFWLEEARAGRTIDDIAQFFAISSEFQATYGAVDDAEFLLIVYANVLDRGFDQEGYDWWLDQMTTGGMARERVVLLFANSPEFIGLYPYLPNPA